MDSLPIYSLRAAEVYTALESTPDGVFSSEVPARLELYGRNLLTEGVKDSPWRKLFGYLSHPLALLLWLAGAVTLLIGEPGLGLVIWALVLANVGFSFWREHRAEQAMQALRRLLPTYTRVVRDGAETQLPTDQVIPGDLLVLAEGDNIPADARVVEEYGLRTNESTLTGDAVPARKSADASLQEGISELERPNLVFAGTSIVSGTGRAVVYATGMYTQFGRIARLTQAVREEPSPLQAELTRLTRKIAFVALGIGALVFLAGTFDIGLGRLEAFLLAIGIIVAVIPEGLPATVTLSLAMAGQRLAQRGVLVKKLAVIERLGTVSTICTDKSGTLTQNQMTVREIWVGGTRLSVSGIGYDPAGSFSPNPHGLPLQGDITMLLTAAALCNNSRLNPPTPERPRWTTLGDQTEVSLRVAALKGGVKESELAAVYPRIHELPFDARRKRMSTIHRLPSGKITPSPVESAAQHQAATQFQEVAFVKGAPREVLQLCRRVQIAGQLVDLDDRLRNQVLEANDEYARHALRVLALARRELPPRSGSYTVEGVETDLTFLGLMAMQDPPRPEVSQAVQTCLQAGIRMVMVTGDYGLTAESLARRVGMLTTPNPIILTGAEVEGMDDAALQAALEHETIFARMAPEQKLRLVAALQARGEVVAVTGDGVNDAPALRKADVGVAMGIIGTDVAKEAADLILTNDNFASIVTAIEEGRAVFDNIRKFITYIFSSNVPEILPFALAALFNLPLALSVAQILIIDLGTDMLPALGLGMEKPEPDVMQRPPRRQSQPLLDRSLLRRAFLWLGLIEAVLCYSGFFLVYQAPALKLPGYLGSILSTDPGQVGLLAMTVFFAGVVMAQVGNAFACRTEVNRGRALGWMSNRFLLVGVATEIVMILVLIYFPPLARAFNHVSLPLIWWVWLAPYGLFLYTLDWIRKLMVRGLHQVKMKRKEVV